MPTLPGSALSYRNYSNGPDQAGPDAEGKLFRGQLMYNGAGKLCYVVVMWRTEQAAPEIVFVSGQDAGSGGLSENPFRGLRAVWNLAQGSGSATQDAPIPQYAVWKPAAGVPGPQGVPGPKGDKGDPGPAGSGGGLSDTERRALDWLLGWLRPLLD